VILLTGGAGYIGAQTNKCLNEKGSPTVVFDNLSTGHREFVRWGELFAGDLADLESLRRCFAGRPIRAVIHFGASAYVGESIVQPAKYYQNNVANTLRLLGVMREFGVRFLIFSSSCTVYGEPRQLPISEAHPRAPICPYGRTKFMVEEVLRDYDRAYGLKSICLRYFNAAGADPGGELGEWHDPETHLIPLAIMSALGSRGAFTLLGNDYPTRDGTCIRDFIHVADLAEAHVRALELLLATERSDAFNLGNGEGYSVREVLAKVADISGLDISIVAAPRRPGDSPVLISDSRRAAETLGWTPRYPDLASIVKTAWDWHSRRHQPPLA
jgi:UDP-glucose-4-epimerase GalE